MRTAARAFATMTVLTMTACGDWTPAKAPSTLQGATVFIVPENCAGASTPHEQEQIDIAVQSHREWLTSLARDAGYTVTDDPNAPVDLIFRPPACHAASSKPKLEVLGNGRVLAEVSSNGTTNLGDYRSLIDAVSASIPVAAYVSAQHERMAFTALPSSAKAAVAAVATPATPAASVQPAAAATSSLPASTNLVAAPQPQSFAFIVGIDKYRDVPPAAGARADAERFAELAKKTLGLKPEHVRLALEDRATRQDIQRGLAWLKSEVPSGGRAYFFYSGHGAPGTDQSTYLVPYDADAKDIPGTGIAMAQVMRELGGSKAKEVLAITDACFSGAGGRSVLPPGARPLMRVKEEAPSAHLALFTASQGDEISGAAPGENAGVFTKYVIAGLGSGQADIDGDGQVSLQELSDWVSPRVAKDAKSDTREQHPKLIVGSGVGDARSFIVEYGIGK